MPGPVALGWRPPGPRLPEPVALGWRPPGPRLPEPVALGWRPPGPRLPEPVAADWCSLSTRSLGPRPRNPRPRGSRPRGSHPRDPRPGGSHPRGSHPRDPRPGGSHPRGSRPRGPRRADPLAACALPAKPLDQNGVRGHRFRAVDQLVEHLVVAGGGKPELVRDRLFLGARLPPPVPLEGENPGLALGQWCHLPHAPPAFRFPH